MDLITILLLVDSIGLIVATFILTYFFLRDLLKEKESK